MKRKIIVTINCEDKTCGKCDALFGSDCGRFYTSNNGGSLVNTELQGDERGRSLRCRACLAAEAKAKGDGK